MPTPPGWYPEPGQIPDLPPQERWWDGYTWTEHRRPAAGFPPAPPPSGGAGRGPLIAGLVGAVVLVAALAVGAVLLFGTDGDGDGSDSPQAGPKSSAPETPGTPEEEPPPEEEPESPSPPPVGPSDGVQLPVPDGWEEAAQGDGASIGSRHQYTCPGGEAACIRGGSTVYRTFRKGPVKEVAEQDVKENAKEAYLKSVYGGITSHRVVEKGKVTVAGQDGYRVRWRIENKRKPDAFVESVAFPHPDGSGQMLVIRSSVDIHKDAPPLSDLDQLVDGLREVAPGSSGGGGDGEDGEDGGGSDDGPREDV